MLLFTKCLFYISIISFITGWILSYKASYRVHPACVAANFFVFPLNQFYLLIWHFKKMKSVLVAYLVCFISGIVAFALAFGLGTEMYSSDGLIEYHVPTYKLKTEIRSPTHRRFHTYLGFKIDFEEYTLAKKDQFPHKDFNCTSEKKGGIPVNICLPTDEEIKDKIFDTFSYKDTFYILSVTCETGTTHKQCLRNNQIALENLQIKK